jgi:hypothetical protein
VRLVFETGNVSISRTFAKTQLVNIAHRKKVAMVVQTRAHEPHVLFDAAATPGDFSCNCIPASAAVNDFKGKLRVIFTNPASMILFRD